MKQSLYSNNPVYLGEQVDRRPNNDDDAGKRSDDNLSYRIGDLKDFFFKNNYYRIPAGVLVDLGLVNFTDKTDTKFLFTLQRNMNKLFETKKKLQQFLMNLTPSFNFTTVLIFLIKN